MTAASFKSAINNELKQQGFSNKMAGELQQIPTKLVFEKSFNQQEEKWLKGRFNVLSINTKVGTVTIGPPKGENNSKEISAEEPKAVYGELTNEKLSELVNRYRLSKSKHVAAPGSAGLKAATTKAYQNLVVYAKVLGIAEQEILK